MIKTDWENALPLAKSLAPRERAILDLAVKGLIDKEISNELNLQRGTLITYWARIKQKLQAKNRSEIVAIYVRSQFPNVEPIVDAFQTTNNQGIGTYPISLVPDATFVWNSLHDLIDANQKALVLARTVESSPIGLNVVDIFENTGYCKAWVNHLVETRENGSQRFTYIQTKNEIYEVLSHLVDTPETGKAIVSTVRGVSLRFHVNPSPLSQAFVESSDQVAVFDLTGRVIYANPALAILTGHAQVWDTPWSVFDVFSEDARTTIAEIAITQALREGKWTGCLDIVGIEGPTCCNLTLVSLSSSNETPARLMLFGRRCSDGHPLN